jgi:diaminohydroxyphosphoribosylaminopyrimidine deaminase/5-amino-6-(5-phosphoribosylamino)uracil reductase
MNEQDEKYMQAALKLAQRGIGSVEPNPAVGCIIVKGSQIVGKGWHRKLGTEHAEINALQDCKTLGVSPRGATMYVTLEPCCHYAKTPPCTDAISASRLERVVVATIDPSEHANGRGIEQLRNAGVEVQVGLCETQARLLNAPFMKYAATGRCWTILKWAQTIDGMLAHAEQTDTQRWISGELSRKDVQARPAKGKKLTRIVLDTYLRIPLKCRLLATAKRIPLVILTSRQAVEDNSKAAAAIARKGAELLTFPDIPGQSNLHFLLDEISKRGVAQLLVEGGPRVISSFLKEDLADEICVYIAPMMLGRRGAVNIAEPLTQLERGVNLQHVDIKRFGDDVCLTGFSTRALGEISLTPE